jgi:peptidoglycan hydrolase CwlO-like protein
MTVTSRHAFLHARLERAIQGAKAAVRDAQRAYDQASRTRRAFNTQGAEVRQLMDKVNRDIAALKSDIEETQAVLAKRSHKG